MGKKHFLRGPSMKASREELRREVDPADSLTDFYTRTPTDEWPPAKRLRFAVIEEAIALLKKGPINHYYPHQRVDYRDTVAWIDGKVESAPSFSLDEIATLLDLDVGKLRSYMRLLVERQRRLIEAQDMAEAV